MTSRPLRDLRVDPVNPPQIRAARFRGRRWPSPKPDMRILAAIALVAAGVAVTVRVWPQPAHASGYALMATRDLPVGMRLRADDVRRVAVDLPEPARRGLLPTLPHAPLARAVSEGSLLQRADAHAAVKTGTRVVTVDVDSGHMPADISRGQQVDVWATPSAGIGAARSSFIARVIVAAAARDGDAPGSRVVAVQVPASSTGRLIAALHNHDVDLVAVPR